MVFAGTVPEERAAVNGESPAATDRKRPKRTPSGSSRREEGGKESEKVEKEQEKQPHFVYILRCRDGSLYTGWTTHLEERVRTHNQGKGAKYTRSRRPVQLAYWEQYPDKGQALRREQAIKRLSREEKLALIQGQPEAPAES